MKEKTSTTEWSKRYQIALCKHLSRSHSASGAAAAQLGCQAVALGMEPLDIARAHKRGLLSWVLPGGSHKVTSRMVARANSFFAETVIPIERTHRAALESDNRINRLTKALRQRTAESTVATRRLKKIILQRQGAEASLKTSGKQQADLLAKAQRLQKRLQHLTHACLSAQELARKNLSQRLYAQIGQTLLAINLRLLLLRAASNNSAKSLTKEVASTQQVVKQFNRRVERFCT